jgi:hypothetical protein
MSQELMTVEVLKAVLPSNLRNNATQDFADKINGMLLAPETLEEIRSNFITYTKVLSDGKYKVEDYLHAVTYVTLKLMGYSNKDSYMRTFPDRYTSLVARGATEKDISAYVSAYAKNKLVNVILEQSLIPVHVLYRDAFHTAMKTQLELMIDPNQSGKVRSDAANSVLTHTKAPEIKKIELDVGLKNDGLGELRDAMRNLALQQQDMIRAGQASPKAVAGAKIVLSDEQKAGAIDA